MKGVVVSTILLGLTIWACSSGQKKLSMDLSASTFKVLQGGEFEFNNLNHKGIVLIFLSPDCPLCETYSYTLKKLDSLYKDKGILMLGIASGTLYRREEYMHFIQEFNWNLSVLLDDSLYLMNNFGASVTPEVVLLDSILQVQYQGRIDNWPVDLAKKRSVITEHDLQDALEDYLNGVPIKNKKTQAIGCIIEAR